MKKIIYVPLLLIAAVLLMFSGCEEADQNEEPSCTITNPSSGTKVFQDSTVHISIEAEDKDGEVKEIRLYLNDEGLTFEHSSSLEYEWTTADVSTGTHTLRAEAIDNNGAITEDEIQVSVGNVLKASFSADTTLIGTNDTVAFTDQSNGDIDKWEWRFGDGEIDNNRNPTHVYSDTGTYDVKLTVSNEYGSKTEVKKSYIRVRTFGTFTDERDGREYKYVKIGDQVWMAENLNYELQDDDVGSDWYYNNNPEHSDTYGRLYNWEAVMQGEGSSNNNPSGVQGVCPDGWHVPSDDEWQQLEITLGMSVAEAQNSWMRGTNEGSKLAGNAELWFNGDLIQEEEFGASGFSASPSGYYDGNDFNGKGSASRFWTATESNFRPYVRWFHWSINEVIRGDYFPESFGFSVRCVKDE